ncbi:MAG: TadE/TadG family type IV pilus assembly protein [Candidatus Limnocylindrales bacterium]
MTSIAQRRRARGQSLVEFSLILPIFLLVVFGLIDGGRFVYMNSVLSQAAREGARVASVEASWLGSTAAGCGAANGPVCPANVAALKTDVAAAANRMVAPFGSISSSSVYISCDVAGSSPAGTWTGATCAQNTTGDAVSVRVLLTFTPITPIAGPILGSITTSASATMIIN